MDSMLLQNLLDTPTNLGGFPGGFRIPSGGEAALLNQTKEVSMQDKILINEPENNNNNNNNNKIKIEEDKNIESGKNIDDLNTPKFKRRAGAEEAAADKSAKDAYSPVGLELNKNYKQKLNLEDTMSTKPKESSSKRFSLDLDVVNQSDTTKIFSETVNNFKNEPLNQLRFLDQENIKAKESPKFKPFSVTADEPTIMSIKSNSNNIFVTTSESGTIPAQQQEHKKVIFSTVHAPQHNVQAVDRTKANQIVPPENEPESSKAKFPMGDKMELNSIENSTLNTNVPGNARTNQQNIKLEFLKDKYNKFIPMISPTRASLNISPKSAFVVNKKLFN